MSGKWELLDEYSQRLLVDYNAPLWMFVLIQWGVLGYLFIAVSEGRGADPEEVEEVVRIFKWSAYFIAGIVVFRPAIEIATAETFREVMER